MSIAIDCESLEFRYRRGFRLGPLTLRVKPGVVCLVGANGAGKSTLFRIFAGMAKPTRGSLTIRNNAASIGYLPQEMDFPRMSTCAEFLTYVAWVQGVPAAERAVKVSSALSSVGLADKANHRIKALSGGMARRLGVAHALVHHPSIVLLDEPTVGLDPMQRLQLRAVIDEIAQDRIVIVSTHLIEDVRAIAQRILLLREGAISFDGTVAELEALDDPDAPGETPLERAVAVKLGGLT